MHLNAQLKLTVGQATDAGVKKENEDCIGLRVPDQPLLTIKGAVAVVADGVSAAEAGKEASETCVRNFIGDYYATPDAWAVKTAGQKILLALNRWLVGQSQIRGHLSTLSALILKSQQAYIFHIGDSRIYRQRGNTFEQLTQDHSVSINKGTQYLSRAMGMDARLEMDFSQLEIQEGDVFFLSTDGIHDYLPDKRIQELINHGREQQDHGDAGFERICKKLIDEALEAGSHDNISCQLIHVDKLPEANDQDVYQKLSDLPFPPPLEVGQSLDGYSVLKEMQASQRSQIYLVKDENDKRLVMKTPSVNYEDDPAYIDRIILEKWIGQRVDSPYVVKVIEPQKPPTALYTLMEYVDGITLEDWIRENPKPDINEVVRIADLTSRGLRAFHRKDILHQDIKPDNIILDRQGVPKIIDFGSCYAAGVEEIERPYETEDALGTAIYSAPETRFRMKKTMRSDLFSLAVVVYEMLTGKQPFGRDLETLTDQRNIHRLEYVSAQEFNPMVPYWMDGALKTALSPTPDKRHQALSEFLLELQRPDKRYANHNAKPLIQKNPLRFWQGIAAIQACVILWLLSEYLS